MNEKANGERQRPSRLQGRPVQTIEFSNFLIATLDGPAKAAVSWFPFQQWAAFSTRLLLAPILASAARR